MPFKRAGWLQLSQLMDTVEPDTVSMPFKRAGWLQRFFPRPTERHLIVSMPFKRAGWLQRLESGVGVCSPQSFNAL